MISATVIEGPDCIQGLIGSDKKTMMASIFLCHWLTEAGAAALAPHNFFPTSHLCSKQQLGTIGILAKD